MEVGPLHEQHFTEYNRQITKHNISLHGKTAYSDTFTMPNKLPQNEYVPSIIDWILHRSSVKRNMSEPIKKPLLRDDGLGDGGELFIVYECKDDCKTIIDSKHIKEMERFSAKMLDNELWGELCWIRAGEKAQDGQGCTDSAYNNVTRYINPFLDIVKKPDTMI